MIKILIIKIIKIILIKVIVTAAIKITIIINAEADIERQHQPRQSSLLYYKMVERCSADVLRILGGAFVRGSEFNKVAKQLC